MDRRTNAVRLACKIDLRNGMTTDRVKEMIAQAEESEDYERCAGLRDALTEYINERDSKQVSKAKV